MKDIKFIDIISSDRSFLNELEYQKEIILYSLMFGEEILYDSKEEIDNRFEILDFELKPFKKLKNEKIYLPYFKHLVKRRKDILFNSDDIYHAIEEDNEIRDRFEILDL